MQETVTGRTGGAVSLAVGMAQIFAGLPGMRHLVDYWYHFAIMFEALFILTTIDAGTRVARFLVGEFLGRAYAPFGRHDWMPGAVVSTALVVAAWAYFIWTGSITTIWPMFGIANQLLASVALAVGTTVIINAGRARYAWVTLAPALVRRRHHADRRRHERPRQFLPDGHRPRRREALPGLPELHRDGRDDGVRRGDPRERRHAVDRSAGPTIPAPAGQ